MWLTNWPHVADFLSEWLDDWLPTECTYTTALFRSLTYLEKYCFCKKSVTNNFIPFLLFLYCTVFLPRFKCISEEHEMYPRKFNLRHQRGDFTRLLFLDQINLPPPNKKSRPFNNFVLCTLPTPSTIRTQLLGDIIVDWNPLICKTYNSQPFKNQYDDHPNKYFRYLSRSILRVWSLSSQCVWTAFTCW